MEEQFEEKVDYIPLSYKERAVALAEAHPKWSLKTLQKQGCSRLKDKRRLHQWKQDIKRGGTIFDKWKHIETETFDRFKEARECFEQVKLYKIFVEFKNQSLNNTFPYIGFQVTTRTLQQ